MGRTLPRVYLCLSFYCLPNCLLFLLFFSLPPLPPSYPTNIILFVLLSSFIFLSLQFLFLPCPNSISSLYSSIFFDLFYHQTLKKNHGSKEHEPARPFLFMLFLTKITSSIFSLSTDTSVEFSTSTRIWESS